MAELPCVCTRIEDDDSDYPSFFPIFGLYIAGTSLVCLLALTYDVFSAFYQKKRWLPCQLFSLNSLTLALLGIAAKLTVDPTSSMPTPFDQFSKLTGTSLICISMGFLMPSLGTTSKSETLNNMWALSIFVVTVVINIIKQIRSGVIFLLITEHVMVMCFMLVMLMVLWFCSVDVAGEKDDWLDLDKTEFRVNDWSLLRRLKVAYVYAFNHNPQFLLCRNNQIYVVAGLCIACSGVTVQAAIRNLSLEFCRGSLDYGWSVWVIVWVQILFVVVGGIATVLRCLGLSTVVNMPWCADTSLKPDIIMEIVRENKSSFLKINLRDWCSILRKVLLSFVARLCYVYVGFPLKIIFKLVGMGCDFVFKRKYQNYSVVEDQDLDDTFLFHNMFQEWERIKSLEDLKEWMKTSKTKAVKTLPQLLESFRPSKNFHGRKLSFYYWETIDDFQVSSLSVVVLVRIAQILLTPEQSANLWEAYSEVYEIIHFVEDRMKFTKLHATDSRKISKLSEAVRMGRVWKNPNPQRCDSVQSQLDSLKFLDEKFPEDPIRGEISFIRSHMEKQCRRAADGFFLDRCIQQLFVDMVHLFLTQLPQAIYKEVIDSTAEDFYERVKSSLEIVCKIEPLKTHIQWSFPREFDDNFEEMALV